MEQEQTLLQEQQNILPQHLLKQLLIIFVHLKTETRYFYKLYIILQEQVSRQHLIFSDLILREKSQNIGIIQRQKQKPILQLILRQMEFQKRKMQIRKKQERLQQTLQGMFFEEKTLINSLHILTEISIFNIIYQQLTDFPDLELLWKHWQNKEYK